MYLHCTCHLLLCHILHVLLTKCFVVTVPWPSQCLGVVQGQNPRLRSLPRKSLLPSIQHFVKQCRDRGLKHSSCEGMQSLSPTFSLRVYTLSSPLSLHWPHCVWLHKYCLCTHFLFYLYGAPLKWPTLWLPQ